MSDIEFVVEIVKLFLDADEDTRIKMIELLKSETDHPEPLA